jgi:hypothetical protein
VPVFAKKELLRERLGRQGVEVACRGGEVQAQRGQSEVEEARLGEGGKLQGR